MFSRKGLIFLCATVWMAMGIKVEAYMSGCSGGYCFVMSNISITNELLDQLNAQRWCQSNGSQLVEIRNQGIQNSLVNFITGAYGQRLSGWNVLTNGKRASGHWVRLSSGNEAGSGLVVSDQPDASYAYGYLKSTSSGFDLFASRPADSKGGFICTGLMDCSGGVTISGQCYKSFTETISWYDARNRCLDAGGDLASFESITTNAGFNALNGSWISASNSYWIGIRREWWKWQNTSADVKYSAWTHGHPLNEVSRVNSDCLCLSATELKWIECGCLQLSPFVCISVTATTTTTRSSSTIKTTSEATSAVASESDGVSSPTISTMVTSYSTGNDTGIIEQPMGLRCTAVGVIVGLCIGIPLIIVIVALALVIVRQKNQLSREAHLSPKANQTTSSKNRILQPAVGDTGDLSDVTDGPYESMQPRTERMTEGCYQSLDQSNSSVISNHA